MKRCEYQGYKKINDKNSRTDYYFRDTTFDEDGEITITMFPDKSGMVDLHGDCPSIEALKEAIEFVYDLVGKEKGELK